MSPVPLTAQVAQAPPSRLRRRRAGRRRGQQKRAGVYAEAAGKPAAWWAETKVDLRGEPSGIARAYFDAAPVTVYDIEASSLVSPRLASLVGAHSGVWVPMITEERVAGVIVLATTDEQREFATDELSVLQAVAAEAALAFERLRSGGGARRGARAREACGGDRAPSARRARSRRGGARRARRAQRGARARLDRNRRLRRPRAGRRRAGEPAHGGRAGTCRDRSLRDRRRSPHRGPARRKLAAGARAARLLPHRVIARRARLACGGVRRRGPGGGRRTRRRLRRGARAAEPEVSSSSAGTSFGPRFAICPFRRRSQMPPHDGQVLAAPTLAHDDRFPGAWLRRRSARCSRSPSAASRQSSCSCSTTRRTRFRVTISSSPSRSRAPRAEPSSAAASSTPSAPPARSRSSSPEPEPCSQPSSTPPRCSTPSLPQAVELLRVDAAALTSLDERDLVVTAAAGDGSDGGDRCSLAARCERTGRRHAVACACGVRRRVAERQPPRRRCVPRRRQRCLPRRAAERSRRLPLRRAVRLRPGAARVARGRSPGAPGARGERGRGVDERRALPARCRRAGAERRDPREHRGRDRGGRPRRSRRAVEPLCRGDHGHARRRGCGPDTRPGAAA